MAQADFRFDRSTALVVMDIQRDFFAGGAVAIPGSEEIISVINQYIELFDKAYLPIFVTRDWHPEGHVSFKPRGGPWPPHCIQGSEGAEFHPDLQMPEAALIVSKAIRPDVDAVSGFEGTNLELDLKRQKIRRLLVGGLPTDYTVKNTVLEGRQKGFDVYLLTDAIRGADFKEGESQKAIEEMKKAGAIPASFEEIQAEFEKFGYSLNNHHHHHSYRH